MSKYNFIFPGQGSQAVGMSSSILTMDIAKKKFNQTNELLGYDLLDICMNGPNDLLTKTKNTQPAIFTISVIVDSLLKDKGIFPSSVAGHSLGEYSALVSSEVISFTEAIELVILRANEMEKANNKSFGAMAAVLNSEIDDINNILKDIPGIVVIANYNTEKQIVISGESDAIDLAIIKLSEISKRVKCVKLNVSGAFHSPLMKFARDALSNAINLLNFNNAKIPIYQNINASPTQDSSEIKKNLILQLENPVRWSDTILNMIKKDNREFIECGPGSVLTGMNKRIIRDIKTYSINSHESLNSLCIKS